MKVRVRLQRYARFRIPPPLLAPRVISRCAVSVYDIQRSRGRDQLLAKANCAMQRTTPPRRLPDVIGIGPPRTGSTWLYNALRDSVDMPEGVKDTHFLDYFTDKSVDWYADHFRHATGDEKNRRDLSRRVLPASMRASASSARFRIAESSRPCAIRSTELYSVYKLLRHYGWIRSGTFDEIINAWPNLGSGNRYAEYLEYWFESFGRENVLVTMYDELRAEPQTYVNRVCDFIGVERVVLTPRPDLGNDVNSFARAPKNRRLARRATSVINWLNSHQAYGTMSALERAGVWEFCQGRGEPYPRLTPEQDARLRERYLSRSRGARRTARDRSLRVEKAARRAPRTPHSTRGAGMSPAMPRRLPEIIGAGPGRTGTTWLHRVLEGHVDLPYGVKETQFFNTFYDKGIDWYARHFRYATGERKIAEICPYFFHPHAPARIKTHIPNCRVITTLRDPVDHAFSAYKLVRSFRVGARHASTRS